MKAENMEIYYIFIEWNHISLTSYEIIILTNVKKFTMNRLQIYHLIIGAHYLTVPFTV